jgi:hypothetical protein
MLLSPADLSLPCWKKFHISPPITRVKITNIMNFGPRLLGLGSPESFCAGLEGNMFIATVLAFPRDCYSGARTRESKRDIKREEP